MKYTEKTKEKAIAMRKKGCKLLEIAQTLGISDRSVVLYIVDPEYKKRHSACVNKYYKAHRTHLLACMKKYMKTYKKHE